MQVSPKTKRRVRSFEVSCPERRCSGRERPKQTLRPATSVSTSSGKYRTATLVASTNPLWGASANCFAPRFIFPIMEPAVRAPACRREQCPNYDSPPFRLGHGYGKDGRPLYDAYHVFEEEVTLEADAAAAVIGYPQGL